MPPASGPTMDPERAQSARPTHRVDPLEFLPLVLRSEEHTSELQSLAYLVCRLLLEKKKINHDLLAGLIAQNTPPPLPHTLFPASPALTRHPALTSSPLLAFGSLTSTHWSPPLILHL